jgi:hypothetical protein
VAWYPTESGDQKLPAFRQKGGNVEGSDVINLWVSDERGRKREKPQKFKKLKKCENYL